jgi:hypothetical protein
MAHGCFTDKEVRPDLERAQTAVAAARVHWDALLEGLRRHTRSQPSWRFYGRNYGWALAFKKGGRALAALFPGEDRFTVLVILTGDQAAAALADAALTAGVRTLVESLPRFSEGCWVFVPVASDEAAGDALRLVSIRAGTARRRG